MSNDRYDDGLVHGHGWAAEPVKPGLGRDQAVLIPAPAEEPYDDGLVHSHAWASTERSQPASATLPAE